MEDHDSFTVWNGDRKPGDEIKAIEVRVVSSTLDSIGQRPDGTWFVERYVDGAPADPQ